MKILFVGSLPPMRDGISDHNYSLYKHLVDNSKHEIYILPSMSFYEKKDKKIFKMNLITSDQLDKINFDIVHFQIGNAYPSSYVFYVFNLFKGKNVKKIVTFHDFTNTNLAKIIRTIRSEPSNLIYEVNKPSMKEIIKTADKIIVYSEFLKNRIIENHGYRKKIEKLYIGAENFNIKQKKILNSGLKLQTDKFIITSFGFITPRKGYEEVIKALEVLNKKKIKIKYFIIGNFNFFHYKIYLKYLVKKLGLENVINFTGYLDINQTQNLLLKSDVIIQPRKYSNEGASASLTTALFAGKPIITSDIGGFSEYINNDITGILIKHNKKEYEEAIYSLYKDGSKRERIGKEALKWANEHITWDEIAKLHLKLYNNLLTK